MPVPAIVKPNYEGSSKGIGDDSVARDWQVAARAASRSWSSSYPAGVLVEEFIPGVDVTVPFVEGLGDDGRAGAGRVRDRSERRARKYNIYDYRLKNTEPGKVQRALPGGAAARRAGAAARHLQDGRARARHARRRRASTSASARTGASTSSRSTRCRRWSRARRSSPPSKREGPDATSRPSRRW